MEFRYELVPTHPPRFNVRSIENALSAIPEVYVQEGAQREFLFCANVEARRQLGELLSQGEPVSYELLGVVVVHEARIHVHQMTTEAVLAKMQGFLLPLIESYQCRVMVQGEDRTESYRTNWARLFCDEE
ncbi:MAG: hypothetical protein NZV14_03580 [Bryobacteraceae bacterium]|nr:hypothetical protein [Bryobacteraceae bacterium]MDW8377218.1 hypothetical protein [Bryobacterales bacterium]